MLHDSDYIYFLYFVFNSLLVDSVSLTACFRLNDDASHFKLARLVLKIASFEFRDLQYFNNTFMKLEIARLVVNAKCELAVFTSVIVF